MVWPLLVPVTTGGLAGALPREHPVMPRDGHCGVADSWVEGRLVVLQFVLDALARPVVVRAFVDTWAQ